MRDSELAQLLPQWDIYEPKQKSVRHEITRYARHNQPVAKTDALGRTRLVPRFQSSGPRTVPLTFDTL
jgi:hypothetical protein